MVVHSGAKGTIVSRGVDQPEVLAHIGQVSGAHHALFLDFEAEGASLVLRARLTSLEASLPIKYAKTLSTTTASASLLRSPDKLKSAEEARKEYLDAIENHSLLLVPVRLGLRTYSVSDSATVAVPPFVWLEAGVEMALSQARAWTGSVLAGFSWTPQLHIAWMLQARVARLLSGSTVSLTHPDLYAFVGASIISIYGRDALVFRPTIPTPEDILAASGNNPTSVIGTLHFGLELRMKNRIGVIAFIESAPGLNQSPNIGAYLNLGFIKFHTLGFEVSFCF